MSEFVIFVESITGAGWLFLCALGVVAVGFIGFDRKARPKPRIVEKAPPGERHAA